MSLVGHAGLRQRQPRFGVSTIGCVRRACTSRTLCGASSGRVRSHCTSSVKMQRVRQRHRSRGVRRAIVVKTASTQRRQQEEAEWFCTQCKQEGRCGVTLEDCCCGSRDVAASHSQTAVAAAETLRRHTLRLLLRQQGRCGVTLSDCCCGSRDVAASHSHTAVAAAEMLRRHSGKLLLRQRGRCQWWSPRLR